MIFSNKQTTKALIRLHRSRHRCTGWSAPLLFATPQRQVFSLQGSYYTSISFTEPCPHPMDGKDIEIYSSLTPEGPIPNPISGMGMPNLKYGPNGGQIKLIIYPGSAGKSENSAMYHFKMEVKRNRIQQILILLMDKDGTPVVPPHPLVSSMEIKYKNLGWGKKICLMDHPLASQGLLSDDKWWLWETDFSPTPNRDFHCFYPCEIFLSHTTVPALAGCMLIHDVIEMLKWHPHVSSQGIQDFLEDFFVVFKYKMWYLLLGKKKNPLFVWVWDRKICPSWLPFVITGQALWSQSVILGTVFSIPLSHSW